MCIGVHENNGPREVVYMRKRRGSRTGEYICAFAKLAGPFRLYP